jgi:predicted nucleotide-binding protein
MSKTPKVIVFSASEHLSVANAIKTNLDRHQIEVRIWDEMVFHLSRVSLDSLISEGESLDV